MSKGPSMELQTNAEKPEVRKGTVPARHKKVPTNFSVSAELVEALEKNVSADKNDPIFGSRSKIVERAVREFLSMPALEE